MPATAEPAPKKRSPKRVKKKPGRQAAEKSKPTEAVEAEAAEEVSAPASIEELQEELAKYKEFFGEIDSFVSFVADRKKALLEVAAREAELKEELKSVKEERQQLENAIGGAKDSLYHLVEPGAMEYMPLLDKMEPADPEKHGASSAEWRGEPIAALNLSPLATKILVEADVVAIGQLQDRVVEDAEKWHEEFDGITSAMAAAIADQLNDFIFSKESPTA